MLHSISRPIRIRVDSVDPRKVEFWSLNQEEGVFFEEIIELVKGRLYSFALQRMNENSAFQVYQKPWLIFLRLYVEVLHGGEQKKARRFNLEKEGELQELFAKLKASSGKSAGNGKRLIFYSLRLLNRLATQRGIDVFPCHRSAREKKLNVKGLYFFQLQEGDLLRLEPGGKLIVLWREGGGASNSVCMQRLVYSYYLDENRPRLKDDRGRVHSLEDLKPILGRFTTIEDYKPPVEEE